MPALKLTEYRKQHNLTLAELADDMNISTGTLHKIERAPGYNTTRRVLEWCRRNNYDPQDVFPSETTI